MRGKVNLNIEPKVSFWRAKCTIPTCGEFWSFSCSDRTGNESCLRAKGESGGEADVFADWKPSKLKGGTISILPTLWEPKSGLYRSGLDGKLPVNKGDVNGVGKFVPCTPLKVPDTPLVREIRIPLREQNVSSDRAWWMTLPESGLWWASTSSTLRLQPKEGLFSSSTVKYKKTSTVKTLTERLLPKLLGIIQHPYQHWNPFPLGIAETWKSRTICHHADSGAVFRRHSWRRENCFECIHQLQPPTSSRLLDQSHRAPYHSVHQLQM